LTKDFGKDARHGLASWMDPASERVIFFYYCILFCVVIAFTFSLSDLAIRLKRITPLCHILSKERPE